MKRYFFRLTIGMATIVLLAFAATVIAKAGSQCYPSSQNYLPLAQYYHTVENHPDPYWSAGVRSYTANPTRVMDDIGYSYWTVQQRCNGEITDWVQYGGDVLNNVSSYWAATTRTKVTCDDVGRLGESLGNHDFYDWPYSHIYPYSYEDGWIP